MVSAMILLLCAEKGMKCNDLSLFLSKMNESECTLENNSRKNTVWVGWHDKFIHGRGQ